MGKKTFRGEKKKKRKKELFLNDEDVSINDSVKKGRD